MQRSHDDAERRYNEKVLSLESSLQEKDSQIQKLKTEVDSLTQKISATGTSFSEKASEVAGLQSMVKSLEKSLNEIQEKHSQSLLALNNEQEKLKLENKDLSDKVCLLTEKEQVSNSLLETLQADRSALALLLESVKLSEEEKERVLGEVTEKSKFVGKAFFFFVLLRPVFLSSN